MNHALHYIDSTKHNVDCPQYDARELIFCAPYIHNGKRQQIKKQVRGACNVTKEVSFSSFKFSMADNRNSEILLWSLHGATANKHRLKFRFVK